MSEMKQFVVFGIDRFGASVARTLEESGHQVVAVDEDSERVQDIADEVTQAITADVTDPDAMESLGLKNMDGAVISIVDSMEANIVAAMICKQMGIPEIIARAKNDVHGMILNKIGVTRVVFPEREMGARVGRYLAEKDFTDWIVLSPEYSLVELRVLDSWVGKSLVELDLRRRYGLNVVGIKAEGEDIIPDFSPEEPLQSDGILFVVGKNDDLKKLNKK